MADVKWIKLATEVFDNKKIKQIEVMPEGDAILIIWFKILCLAGEINDSGMVYFTEEIPYTEDMLATQFGRPIMTVKLALATFERFGMIEVIDDIIHVSNWEKYQNIEGLERVREQTRKRVAKHRENKRLLALETHSQEDVTLQETLRNNEVTQQNKNKIENKNIITVSKDTVRQTDVQRIVDEWNSLSQYGIKSISKLSNGSKRYQSLVARINQYGMDEVLKAIDNIRHSDFLQGKTDSKRVWVITFDWFVLPNNFPKVLEGQYENKGAREEVKSYESTVSVQLWE